MAKTSVTLTYEDGRTETIVLRPVGLVAAERHFKGDTSHAIEMTFWAAWYLKGMPSTFDEWLATLEDISEKSEPVVPLDKEPSPGS